MEQNKKGGDDAIVEHLKKTQLNVDPNHIAVAPDPELIN